MGTVKIGFVGVGAMGQCAHLKNYVALPDCEVVAIAELREKLAKQVAAHYNVPRVYKDHQELLANEQLDGIVAAQQFTQHGGIVPKLLEAKVPIFIEKPLAGSVEVGERIVEAVRESGTWVMVGYHKRSDPATIYAKAEIDRLRRTGELGEMRYVRILMPPGPWPANGFDDLITTDEPLPELKPDPPASDMDSATYQTYVRFVNYYCHQINLMRHLLGEPYQVTYADPSGVVAVVESESGIAGVIEMSPYTTTKDWQESAVVCFEHGYVKLDLPHPIAHLGLGRVEVFKDPSDDITPTRTIPVLPWIHAMRQQAMNFVGVIKGEISPPCDAEEALEDLKVTRQYIRLLGDQ